MAIEIICDGCGNQIGGDQMPNFYVEVRHPSVPIEPGLVPAVAVRPPSWPPAGQFHSGCFPDSDVSHAAGRQVDGDA